MKFRTNALGLRADCLHKVPLFGFVRFLSENSLHSKFFHSRSQPAVRNFCSVSAVHSEPFSRLNEIRSVSTSRCLARDQIYREEIVLICCTLMLLSRCSRKGMKLFFLNGRLYISDDLSAHSKDVHVTLRIQNSNNIPSIQLNSRLD